MVVGRCNLDGVLGTGGAGKPAPDHGDCQAGPGTFFKGAPGASVWASWGGRAHSGARGVQ